MMIRNFALIGFVMAAVAACSKAPSNEGHPAAQDSAPAESAQVKEPESSVKVAGVVSLTFPHVIRSNSEATVDGVVTHTLRVEYKDVEEDEVKRALDSAFSDAGYKIRSDGVKFVAMSDSNRIRYSISPQGPDLKVALSSPESKGLVTFIW